MTSDDHDETDAFQSEQFRPITDEDPTADLTAQLEGLEPDPADLESAVARGYARGILSVFRGRRRLFGSGGMQSATVGKARAAAVCFADIGPEDLPRHVRHAFLRVVYLARLLEDAPTDRDLRDYAEQVFDMGERLEEFLERAFGAES